MENQKQSIAIYIDLENINSRVDLKELMTDISLQYTQEEYKPVYAVKIAAGNSHSINKYRKTLTELNYEIRETPHVSGKKNRADLIISLDAFEKIYINQPEISLFVFITNDSDYSVIMDLLRKHGKDVWLVTKEQDSKRNIFQNSTDNILIISEYIVEETKTKPTRRLNIFGLNTDIDKRTVTNMVRVLRNLDNDKKYEVKYLNNQFHKRDNSLKLKNSSFNSFKNLYKFLSEKGLMKIEKVKGKSDKVYDIDTRKINRLIRDYDLK